MAQVWLTAAIVVFFCCLSALNACQWAPDIDLNQGLDVNSFKDGEPHLTLLSEITTAEDCRKACCERDDCQLALIGTPADGLPQCHLVNCMKDGEDVCVLSPNTQFMVYRKVPDTAEQQPQNKAEVRAVNNTDHCRLPAAVGNCRAAFPQFYYNVTDQTCKQFIFGGCGGNDNNFKSLEECEASCAGVTGEVLVDSHPVAQRSRMSVPVNEDSEPKAVTGMTLKDFQEKCQAPAQTGPCRASHRRYYYNNGTCQPFVFGGCQGNQNNYETPESCMMTCTVKVIPRSQKTPDPSPPNSFEEACSLPSDTGPCRAAHRMFFFETSSQSCKPFVYGGCKGNLNRYSSEEACMLACSGQIAEHGLQKRNRWTPGFFLVATLAIMSGLLLVGLVLIVVRRNSRRRFLILDDKEELLRAEEQVSYEKLSQVGSS